VQTVTADTDVYLPPVPDREPSLTPGQKFLYLPHDPPGTKPGPETRAALVDARGKSIARKNVVLRILTLVRVGAGSGKGAARSLHFHLDGVPGEVRMVWNGTDATALPDLYALVEDDSLRALRKLYVGRRVWGLGGLGVTAIPANPEWGGGFATDGQTPLTVKGLYRVALNGLSLSLGSTIGSIGADQYAFADSNPLIAVLDVPRSVRVTGAQWYADISPEASMDPTSFCIGYYCMFADGWQMSRSYSLLPLDKAHPEWSRTMRRSIREGSVRKGMTPEMVLWTLGWPAIDVPLAVLRKETAWAYDSAPPFHYWVYFKNGRATDFGPDGSLP
jgi:hypothetical protein